MNVCKVFTWQNFAIVHIGAIGLLTNFLNSTRVKDSQSAFLKRDPSERVEGLQWWLLRLVVARSLFRVRSMLLEGM